MQIIEHICDICYMDGKKRKAKHKYYAPLEKNFFDICKKHKQTVEEAGLPTFKIDTILRPRKEEK